MTSRPTVVRRPRPGLAALAAIFACWPTIAAAEPVDVLHNETKSDSGTTEAQAVIYLPGFPATNALVFVTASGQAIYTGPTGSSGIVVSIQAGDVRIDDQSSEGQSINITYRAAASHVFVLPRNTPIRIVGRTEAYGSQSSANQGSIVRLEVIAIAAD